MNNCVMVRSETMEPLTEPSSIRTLRHDVPRMTSYSVRPPLRQLLPSSVTAIGLLWTLLSIVLAFLSMFAFVSSTWVLQFPDTDQNGFGPLKACELNVRSSLAFVQTCHYFLLTHGLMNWPSSPFQVTAILYSVGTLFLLSASALAAASLVTRSVWRLRLTWLAGYFQLSAVLVQSFALAIFPMGFSSGLVEGYCGPEVGMYRLGHCSLGWGYVLAIITTSLLVFCPFLSKFSTSSSPKLTRLDLKTSPSMMAHCEPV